MSHTTEQLEAMLAAATPGPWVWDNFHHDLEPVWQMGMAQGFGFIDWADYDRTTANAALIAAAPTITAELIAARRKLECKALRAQRDTAEAQLREAIIEGMRIATSIPIEMVPKAIQDAVRKLRGYTL